MYTFFESNVNYIIKHHNFVYIAYPFTTGNKRNYPHYWILIKNNIKYWKSYKRYEIDCH